MGLRCADRVPPLAPDRSPSSQQPTFGKRGCGGIGSPRATLAEREDALNRNRYFPGPGAAGSGPTFLGEIVRLGWLDPSLDSNNSGDLIIAEAVAEELETIAPISEFVRLPTQRLMNAAEARQASNCNVIFAGGTNLVGSNMLRHWHWRLGPREIQALRNRVVLLGVGWWQYQGSPSFCTRKLLQYLLHPDAVHSVRDGYTAHKVNKLGLSVLNTGCPTMWSLGERTLAALPKNGPLVLTLTDYARNPLEDAAFVRLALDRYDPVFFWPQGREDLEYIQSLSVGLSRLTVLPRGIGSLDATIQGRAASYIGTRLHAGIRAIQLGAPALVIAVDNRATEISRDTGLPTVERRIESLIDALERTHVDEFRLSIPLEKISSWRDHWVRKSP